MAEPLYNVVIEHPRSQAPGAHAALAVAIAARYGIPVADLERRLTRGRFKVKSRVDKSTADTYAADLTRLGAVCVVQSVDEPPTGSTGQFSAVSGPIDTTRDDTSQVRSAPRPSDAPPTGARASRPSEAPPAAARAARPSDAPPVAARPQRPSEAPPAGGTAAPAPAKWPSEAPRTEMSEPPRMSAPPAQAQPPARWPNEAPRTEMSEPPRMPAPPSAPAQAKWPTEAPRTEMTEPPRMFDAASRGGTEPSQPRIAPGTLEPSTEPPRTRVPGDAIRPLDATRPAVDPARPRVAAESLGQAMDAARARAAEPTPAPEPPRPRAPDPARPAPPPPRSSTETARVQAEAARSATEPLKPWGPSDAARPGTERGARVAVPGDRATGPATPPPAPPSPPARPSTALPLTPPPASSTSITPPTAQPASPPVMATPPAPASAPLDLGALSAGFPLTLSTLDGASSEAGAAARVAQNANLPASFGPPSAAEPAPPPGGPSSSSATGVRAPTAPGQELESLDPFAPPRAAVELEMMLDTSAPSRRDLASAAARTTAQRAAVAEVPWPASTLPPRISESRPGATMAATAAPLATREGMSPHLRLVAGAVLAVGLGFIPAHFVAKAREDSTYQELDAELTRRESTIRSRADYDAFESVRAATAERKRSARQNIALTSLALWALVGGGVGWLWFRRITPIR